MKLSVIVPMYNVKTYIEQCLDSLKNQTLKNMEVILVDDGCTDDTPLIAESYVRRYPNIFRLIHKKNGGLSDARNAGLPHAQGEYIAFLDSDDFVEPTLYEKMIAKIESEQADICVTDIEYWYMDANKRWVMKGITDWPADTLTKKAMLSPMFAWNKVYKRKFFFKDNLRYPYQLWYEDIPVTTTIFATSNKIAYLDECLIHYRQREGSIMSVTNGDRLGEIFTIMSMVRENFQKMGIYDLYQPEIEYLHIEHLRLYGMFRFIRSDQWEKYYKMSEQTMKEYFPNWKNNIYIKNLNMKNRLFLQNYSHWNAGLVNNRLR